MDKNQMKYELSKNYLLREYENCYYLINIFNGDIKTINKSGYMIAKSYSNSTICDVCIALNIEKSNQTDKLEQQIKRFTNTLIAEKILVPCFSSNV